MEVKKCIYCGNFIMNGDDMCESCAKHISFQNTIAKNYFEENPNFDSIPLVSATTGIEPDIIQNYIQNNNEIDSNIDTSSNFNSIQF